jgi:hypothetical protein
VADQPRMVAGQPAHVAKAPPFYPNGAVVELKREIVEGKGGKEEEGGRSATNLWLTGHAWPPLNLNFYPPLHLAPVMLTPLTKSIRRQSKFLSSFSKVLFIYFNYF